MTPAYMKIIGTYDLWLVLLSYAISVFGSFTALQLAGHVIEEKRNIKRILWIICAAVALGGGGIWSMHFIAILAYKLPIAVNYDVAMTAASLVAAVVVTGVGLYVVTGRNLSMSRLCVAGVFVGLGVVSMHYMGMEAMRMAATLEYDPLIVVLSVVVAIVVATVGLLLMVTMRKGIQRIVSAFVIAFAVSGMHYTAMFGTTCRPMFSPEQNQVSVAMSPDVMAGSISAATALVLILGLLLSFLGRRGDRRSPVGGEAMSH